MTNKTMIAKAVKVALYSGFAASLAVGAPATFAADEDDSAEAEKIVVTGSRLKRTDVEGANPVTVIDREQIELSGAVSAAELLRNTTFNSSGSFRPQSGSSAQGTAAINLRGIGSSRTLVLIDGRRLTMSPSTGADQDLNSIPIGAIERVEILTSGASAIYGSDAIGGVVNVITRTDYNGAELTLGRGSPSIPADGGDRESGSLLFGSSNDTTSVLGGVSWNKREIVYQRDFPWVESGASTYGNNWQSVDNSSLFFGQAENPDGSLIFDDMGNPVPAATPILGLPNACGEENFFIDGDRCRYNFNATNANEASNSNEALYLKARHQINDDWEVYANANISRTESFGRYAPAPDSNGFYAGLTTPTDSYNNPTNPDAWYYDANNPNATTYDPTVVGPNVPVIFYHRFAAAGNRDNSVENQNRDLLLGTSGYIGNVEVDFGMRRVRNQTNEIGNGYLAAQTAWSFVNDFNPGYGMVDDGTGTMVEVFDPSQFYYGYNLQVPSSNPDSVLAGSVVTTSRVSKFDIDEVYASAAFDMFEMDGGTSQTFVGIERREEFYSDQYDSQSEAGLVGGSAGNSAGGGRSVNAAYFETVLPFTEDFELNVAGRFDDYSDYGNDFSPKISARWEITDELLLRASYGQGFRAPTLDILTQKTAFSADSVNDAASCAILAGDPEEECQINAYRIANPNLESEQSDQYAIGVAYQPSDWFNLAADIYNIEIDNRIAFFSSQNLIDRELAGDPVPSGLGVQRDTTGLITRINTGYGNEGDLTTRGIDLNARFNFDFEEAGRLASNFQVSWTDELSIDGGRNSVRDPGTPQWRSVLNNVYSVSDFQVAWNVNAIGGQYTDVVAIAGDDGVGRSGNIGVWVTHDLQFNYSTPWDGQIAVGARNIFEKYPQLEGFDGREYNYNLYNGYGRVTYVRYTQTF